jgi:FlaA1/EpsC-like NDP-sugar epimerase
LAADASSYPGRWLPSWPRYRRVAVAGAHVLLAALANYAAFWLRFDGDVPDRYFSVFLTGLPWILVARLVAFHYFRLHDGVWRYAGLWDLRSICLSTALSSLAFLVWMKWILGVASYPRSVYVFDAVLVVFLIGGTRLAYRAVREIGSHRHARRILLIGAGDAGALAAREMWKDPERRGVPVGFVDDDPAKRGLYIHGVRVFGPRCNVNQIIQATRADEVLITMPSVPASTLRDVVASLEPCSLPIKMLPRTPTTLDARAGLNEIRPLAIEDLLARPPVGLDPSAIRHLVHGRRVLVTGAGGSIGSELCRQIAALGPTSLVMLDRSENGLFAIQHDLEGHGGCTAVIADVTDRSRLDQVFAAHRPEVVFHAAAHKHVPLMEANPCEAVKNNVTGTRLVAEAAARHEVAEFILISSDKAVNPTSVMGASKRVAEQTVLWLVQGERTVFAAVRFGNVLGSNGSVVPLFAEQIRRGRPITVTHPEMRRYFMLISEAVQLVLHAATLARGGELFVLEMGEQIRIVDMARALIRLSGLRPDEDVPIVFTGMRPGEKLYEELVEGGELVEASRREKIACVRSQRVADRAGLARLVEQLEQAAGAGDAAATIDLLRQIVPTFSPIAVGERATAEPPAGALVLGATGAAG